MKISFLQTQGLKMIKPFGFPEKVNIFYNFESIKKMPE